MEKLVNKIARSAKNFENLLHKIFSSPPPRKFSGYAPVVVLFLKHKKIRPFADDEVSAFLYLPTFLPTMPFPGLTRSFDINGTLRVKMVGEFRVFCFTIRHNVGWSLKLKIQFRAAKIFISLGFYKVTAFSTKGEHLVYNMSYFRCSLEI